MFGALWVGGAARASHRRTNGTLRSRVSIAWRCPVNGNQPNVHGLEYGVGAIGTLFLLLFNSSEPFNGFTRVCLVSL